ncbi:MAG TPA: glycosyltransferase [Solirubrobacteraceae bacterium]|nr:glycosyltransferase [Solirubrobacteraceae bacterium]
MSNLTITFVILNWRNAAATRACADSIARQRSLPPHELIVVDNESTPSSARALDGGPWRLVTLDTNRGFTGGMNAGAGAARGRFIALLNNDVRLADDWSERALAAMAEPRVAIVGGRDEHTTVPVVSPLGFLALSDVELPRMRVAAVDGGHLLIRATAWRGLGGFDDDFFAYHEDLDLCARALARGWQIVFDPALRVSHARGTSSDRVRWRRVFWARRNRTIWLAKHFPHAAWREAILAAALEYAAEGVRGAPGGPSGADAVIARSAALAGCLWVVTHGRWLAAKRRTNIGRGLYADSYRNYLAEVYDAMTAVSA